MTFFGPGQTQEELTTGPSLGSLQDQDFQRRLKLVTSAAPIFAQGEGLKMATQMAQSREWDDETLRKNAQVAGGQVLVNSYKQYLGSIEDPWKQLQAFKQFDSGQQKLLTRAGYVPPEARDPGPKGLGIITHAIGETLGDIAKVPGPRELLKGLDYLGGLGTHTYRAARLGIEEEGLFGTSLLRQVEYDPAVAQRRKNIVGDFQNLWSRTKEGEQTFSLKAQERVSRLIPDVDKYQFVSALASGKTVTDYLTEDLEIEANTPLFEEQLQKYSQYQGQDDIAEAVKDLRNSKYSPGRDFAEVFTPFRRGTAPFNILSGGVDGAFRIVSDPTLAGGRALKAYRLGKYGITRDILALGEQSAELAGRVDYLATIPRFRRAADEIASAFRDGNEVRLLDTMPQMRGGGLNDLNSYLLTKNIAREAVTSEEVFSFYKSNLGSAALMAGKFAAPHFPGTILPSLSKPEALRSGIALGTKNWVAGFRLEDYGFEALDPNQLKELFGVSTTALNVKTAVGDAIHSFYTKIPKKEYMKPDDDASLDQFRAVLDYSLPGFLRDDYVSEFMRTSDIATRRSIYESGVQAMFHYSGALQTKEGQKLMAKVLRRGQAYAANGVDLLDNKPTGIGEADLAEAWGIPDFRDMLKATAETTKFRRFLDGTNDGLINRFFANYWKPAVLLKAGFIPRAYGEEFLGFILREGPTAWVKGQAAFTATKEGYTNLIRPVSWIADSLVGATNLTIRNTPLDIYAYNFANSTDKFVKNWAGKLTNEHYIAGARSLAANGAGMQSLADEVGTMFGEVAKDNSVRVTNETIGRIDENGEILQVPIKHGEFVTHQRGSGFFAHSVLREMRRMQTDRLFAPLIDAGRRQFALDEGQKLVSQFADAGLIEGQGNYVVGLRKMRQLIPNKVMPKFEAMLKYDSHASFDSVVDELVENGVDHRTAVSLVSNIKNLEPRQRVAIFTRDGELERMYQPHTLDPDAQWDFDSDLPFVRGEIEKQTLREYHDVLEELWSPVPSTNAYWRISRQRLNAADMQETVGKSFRSRMTLDGRTVAEPPAKGTRRVYTLVMDQDPTVASAFEDLGQTQVVSSGRGLPPGSPQPQLLRQNPLLDQENGYVPFQSAEVNGLIPDHTPDTRTMTAPGGEQITPEEMAWFTQDFSHAQNLHNTLTQKYKGQKVSIGYVDVPEDVFQQGRNAAKANVAGGVDPLALQNRTNQVWIPKTWRENYQVLGDNYQMIDGHAAVGATRDEALQDWATVLGQRYQQVFEAKDYLGLRDMQHNLIDGRMNVNQIIDSGQYLPDQSIGPAILESSKESWFKGVVQSGFDVVGKAGNAMIRNQMFLHYYAENLRIQTERMARLLSGQTADSIQGYADRLGTTHYQLASDWRSLPDDIRNAANPYEAMIARDPIPPSLRTVVDPEDQKALAEAWTAFYEWDNPDLLEEARKLWTDKYVKTGLVKDYTFQDLQNSYLSLEDDLRHSILDTGYPPQMPKSFENADLDADEWTQLRDSLQQNSHIYKTAHDLALKAAINDTVPWIDDYRVRSQFQQHGSNIIPFWFSQENFIKRVANNVYRDPAAIRKAQVTMDALHNSGFVTQNQYGEDVYNIPLTGTLMKTVAKLVDVLPGDFQIPVINPMTGQLKYTIPGLDIFDRVGPSLSPLGAIPLAAASRIFPELGAVNRALVGDRGIKDELGWDIMMRTLLPSYAHKIYEGFAKDFGTDSEYASAMIQTAQMLEVSGNGLPENAEPYEYDDYMDRLENFTRLQMIVRGMVGFFSPAAPSTNPTEEFTPEFQELLKKMPIEEALLQFMTDNPTARAYTVVKTETPSKAPLSASQEAGKVLDEHQEYFDKYKMAGPWLLPQSDDDSGFSSSVYNKEIARELRRRKTVKEWYDDYYFASGAEDYFDTKESYELRMAAAKGNAPLRQQYTAQYQTWKEDYFKQHKIFARLLNDPDAAQRRQQVLDQMDAALSDSGAPDAPHKDSLKDLVDTYKGYIERKSQYKRNTNAEKSMRDAMTDQFTLWVKGYVDKNPGVKAFYERIIRPELGVE